MASKVKSLALVSKPQVVENCPVLGLKTATFFKSLKFCRLPEKKLLKIFFFWRSPEKNCEDLFWRSPEKFVRRPFFLFFLFLFFLRTLATVSLILDLGLEHSCPWSQEGLFSEGLFLALASDFFVFLALASDFLVFLALASSLVSSTPPLLTYVTLPSPPDKT